MVGPTMNPLTADTLIAVASGVKAEFRDAAVRLSLQDAEFAAGTHGLTVLDLFRQPQSMAQAMAQLAVQERDPKVWMQISATIYALWSVGVLCEAGAAATGPMLKPLARCRVHTQPRMLNDRTRTHGFLRAIRDTVKRGDVVIDLGTGTGILAIAAARAGAEHVYAIEMSDLADIAAAMFKANGLSDRITILRGKSNDLELPNGVKANVLITETIGDGPFGEYILESVTDARQRLLTPGARIIPVGIDVGVVALRLPQDLLEKYNFTAQNTAEWKRDYGIDFSRTLLELDENDLTRDLVTYRLRTEDYVRCETLGMPVVLTHVDFATHPGTTVEAAAQIKIEKSGALHGIAMYFRLDIGGGQALATAPRGTPGVSVKERNAWRIPIWLRLQPLKVAAGDVFNVRFSYAQKEGKLEVVRA
ncbi:MAG: 50S ribosomal protein L11 methyltransferase, partial [Terriglobales bacterium]